MAPLPTITSAFAIDGANQKKGKGIALVISIKDLDGITNIIKWLENLGNLEIDEVIKIVKHQIKKQECEDFLVCY